MADEADDPEEKHDDPAETEAPELTVVEVEITETAEVPEAPEKEETSEDMTDPAAAPEETELLLFATQTCPNCRQAEKLLDEAGVLYRRVMVEENRDLAVEYGIRQAPTLIIGGETPERFVGVGAIRRFITDGVKVH